ncbi:hypothetical protein SBA4_6430011 [Candidatus Sulfopaludibacter sp. SbA4]|nr:hypothetical protein SBA4_6430011 [Candidatus Sulfopaludibacter sp. SbA4]
MGADARRLGERRLKAGGSQDWLPHKACDTESTTCEEVSGEKKKRNAEPEKTEGAEVQGPPP